MKILSLIAFLFLLPLSALADPGDTLYVAPDEVDIWSGPEEEGPVVFRLKKNHELYEYGRNEDWVFVKIGRTKKKSGWLHETLVALTSSGPFPTYSDAASYQQFKSEVEEMDALINPHPGQGLYRKIEYLGDGIVQLIVTNKWLGGTWEEKELYRDFLYRKWIAILDENLPVQLPKASVRLADSRGNLIMIINENE